MANESNKELTSVWTPANIVTCVRIVFIPVFMIVSALSHECCRYGLEHLRRPARRRCLHSVCDPVVHR